MKNLTEITISNYGKKTIWMTFVCEGTLKIMFSDRTKSLGEIVFKDETVAEGIFKYLSNRLPKIKYSSVCKWLKRLTAMDGGEALFCLAVYNRTLCKAEVKGLINKLRYSMEDDDHLLVAKDEESDYFGEFQFIQFNKYEFKYY